MLTTEDYQFTDLIKLNQQLLSRFEVNSPILCGHSLGGMIQAGTIAKYQIKTASLVLFGSLDSNPVYIAPKYMSKEKAKQQKEALTVYINEGFGLFKKQGKYDYFENRHIEDEIANIINRRYTNPVASQNNLKTLNDFNVRKQLVEMNIPTLVCHGKKEQVIVPELVEGMVKENPNAKVEWYPDNGHLAFYQQPELTLIFLEKHYDFINH